MKIKRYVVREMQEAIKLIKYDLGPEAVIVSSYRVPAKGLTGLFMPRMLEVTAALDDPQERNLKLRKIPAQLAAVADGGILPDNRLVPAPMPLAAQKEQPPRRKLYLTGSTKERKEPNPNPNPNPNPDTVPVLTVEALPQEEAAAPDKPKKRSRNRKKKTTSLEVVPQDKPKSPEPEGALFAMLMRREMEDKLEKDSSSYWREALSQAEVDETIIDTLLSKLGREQVRPGGDLESAYLNIKRQLVHLLEPAYKEGTEKARILTFVGPTGVGKTTTLAKLATIFSFNECKKIALIAVQSYRLGSAEQLQKYGDFLGVPVEMVMTPEDLRKAVEKHADKDYILVDTAGRSARHNGSMLELKSFIDVISEPQEIYLVLSLTTKNKDLHKITAAFKKVKSSKIIFTKIDETESYGAVLNMVAAHGLPVSYLADGQGIPDYICKARPHGIAELLLKGANPN